MKIAIRMDDITPDMDWNAFSAFEELLNRNGIKPLIGVVPKNQDTNLMREEAREDFWEWLKKKQEEGWCIAQHGYSHVYSTKKGGIFPLNRFSEYAGVAPQKQQEMIADGKKILEAHGIHTDIFMAPGHTFDKNTLRVLRENGFQYVTDGFGKAPYRREGLVFLPISSRRKDCFREKDGYTTIVFHTNGMEEAELGSCAEMFAAHKEKFIPYSEWLEQPVRNRGMAGNLKEYMEASAKRITVKAIGLLRGK